MNRIHHINQSIKISYVYIISINQSKSHVPCICSQTWPGMSG